jgi:hypothetical protein
MPVNMDPKKRLRKQEAEQPAPSPASPDQAGTAPTAFGKDTPEDKEKALADAEWKNLWDATEVIDMDKW